MLQPFLCWALVSAAAPAPVLQPDERQALSAFLADTQARLAPEASWPILGGLHELTPSLDRSEFRSLVASFEEALGQAAQRGDQGLRLTQLVLAVGLLGENAGDLARPVAERLEESRDPRERLACAVTLVNLGDDGLRRAMAVVKSRNLVGGALACGVALAQGEPSSTARKALLDVTRDEDFRGFLLSQAALRALQAESPKVLEQARKNQEKVRGQVRMPVVNGLNWGGITLPATREFLAFLQQVAGTTGSPQEYALPETPYPGGKGRLYEGYSNCLWHLTGAAGEIATLLAAPEFPSWESFSAAAEPWAKTVGLLQVVEQRHPPSE